MSGLPDHDGSQRANMRASSLPASPELVDKVRRDCEAAVTRIDARRAARRRNKAVCPWILDLGARVRIVAAGDICGIIVDHIRYLDGSERWGVEFWHGGERHVVNCRADELELCAVPAVVSDARVD